MSTPASNRYEQLAELAERELELVEASELERLADIADRRAALISELPPVPPAQAGPALERAALMQRRVMLELMRRREAVLLELAGVEQAQRMASGYAPRRRSGLRIQASA